MDNNENFNDNIEDILSDFNTRKEKKEQMTAEPLAPPIKRKDLINFAKSDKTDQNSEKSGKLKKEKNAKKAKKPKKTQEELEKIKAHKAEKQNIKKQKTKKVLLKIKSAVFNKKTLIAIAVILTVIGIIFGVQYAVKASKSTYLKPYENKYPQAHFEVGMQKKYCDMIGQNPDTVGYIEIPELDLQSAVSKDSTKQLHSAPCADGAKQFNYVVYLNDNRLEKIYSTIEAYNNSGGYITYSDLFEDYNFKVVGVFYTNTKAEDDNDYIFPYNVTEKMTLESSKEFVSRLRNRFIYNTGIDITRQDTLLTISCPTNYYKDFRFVLVGVLREEKGSNSTAVTKKGIRYPQVICDKMKINNDYKSAAPWYPEIIITDNNGTESTIQKTIEDYKN